MTKLTDAQEELLDDLDDDSLQKECEARGIWPDEFDADECPDCECDDFRPECEEIHAAFYTGKEAHAIELTKKLITAVTGRYL